MKRLLLAFGFLFGAPAFAADNAIVLTPGVGVTERSVDVGGLVQSPMVQIGNSAGTNVIGAGTTVPVSGTVAATESGTWNIATVTAVTNITNPIAATQSGAWTVNPTTAANWGIGATAAGVPANTNYIGMNVAGNLVGLTGTGTSLNVGSLSGAFASGSFASGSVASGAFASGALSSGSVASGAIASGAMVDLGAQADAACSTDNGTCSLIALAKRNNQNVALPATIASATTGGCTGQVILSSATAIFTQVKASAGTLCWIRYQNTGTNVYNIRTYDSATNGNAVCASATGVESNDSAQSNATSPGMVGNLGTFGQAHANGIGICITGALGSNTDVTSATTGLNLNIGFK